MSKLEELIQQYCPDGVEWKPLGDYLSYEQPTKYLVANTKYDDSFLTPVLTAGQSFILGYTNEKVGIFQASKDVPVIIFDDFTTSFHWVDFSFKVKSSAMKMLRPTDEKKALFKYLYYCMKNIPYVPGDHTRQWIGIYSQFEIPVPPLPVQEEIVRILDNFTELQAELQAELQKRLQQYNYYRDNLLSFEGRTDVQWKKLGDVAYYVKNRVNDSLITISNYVSVENLLQNRQGKTNASNVPDGSLIHYESGDILIGNIRPYLKKIWLADGDGGTNGDVLTIRANRELLTPEFLYQCLASDDFFQYDMNHAKGAKMPRGSKEDVLNYMIPITSLAEQQRIVSILDRFDRLTNDLTQGLPAEIEKRRQQYEYYRDKLLTFKRKAA